MRVLLALLLLATCHGSKHKTERRRRVPVGARASSALKHVVCANELLATEQHTCLQLIDRCCALQRAAWGLRGGEFAALIWPGKNSDLVPECAGVGVGVGGQRVAIASCEVV